MDIFPGRNVIQVRKIFFVPPTRRQVSATVPQETFPRSVVRENGMLHRIEYDPTQERRLRGRSLPKFEVGDGPFLRIPNISEILYIILNVHRVSTVLLTPPSEGLTSVIAISGKSIRSNNVMVNRRSSIILAGEIEISV